MALGVTALKQGDAEAIAKGRVRRSFMDDPVEFFHESDEIVRDEVQSFAELRYSDLNLTPLELDGLEPKYTVDSTDGRDLDPESFMDRGIEDFLAFWNREIGSHRNVDLEYAEKVLQGEEEASPEALATRFDLQPQSRDVMDDSETPLYDAVQEEMLQILYGQVLNKDEEFKSEVESFERVLKNYDLEPYQEIVENDHVYAVQHTTDVGEMLESAEAASSCIEGMEGRFRRYSEDEYSMISALEKDGELMGYMRNFLMEDDSGDEYLALDTIEVDHKNFKENSDVVKAAGMASIQMMYDLEADYLVGGDARVKYGLRQAYSNTEKTVSGQKIGEIDVKGYRFEPSDTTGKSAYMLMENPG